MAIDSSIREVPVELQSVSEEGLVTRGSIQIEEIPPANRRLRALKWGGILWAVGAACVLVPILHFILVPGFVVAGIACFLFIQAQSSRMLGGSGVCPKCKSALKIPAQPLKTEIELVCDNCRTQSKVIFA